MSRNPDVIRAAYIIASPASIIRSVANLDRDRAGVTGSVVWTRAITRTVTTIIISASACTDNHRKEKKQENRPFCPALLRCREINNVHLHIIIYETRQTFTRLAEAYCATRPCRSYESAKMGAWKHRRRRK